MEYEFSIIKPFEHSIVRKRLKRLPAVMEKIYNTYLLKYMPITFNEITYMGVPGREIILPFTCEELQDLKESYIEKLWNGIKKKYSIENQFIFMGFQGKLLKKFQIDNHYGNIMNFIMFPQIMKKLLEENKILLKDVRLAIFDSNNRKIELILEVLYKELNYLKIITDRQEYFQEFREMIYHVTGLVAETMNLSDNDFKEANVIIDLNSRIEYNYRLFTRDVVVFDMESSMEKRQYFAAKRKDLRVLYDCEFIYQGEIVEKNMAEMILYGKYTVVREFLQNKRRDDMTKRLTYIGSEFQLGKLKYLNN